jgi:hypothetical protein
VDADTITDGYIVHCHGTRYLANKDETFKKLLSLYPLWSQNPDVDQYQLNMEIADAGDVAHRERIFKKPETQAQPQGAGGDGGEPGGMSAGMNLNNRTRSVQNRNQTQPNTGALLPAGQAM